MTSLTALLPDRVFKSGRCVPPSRTLSTLSLSPSLSLSSTLSHYLTISLSLSPSLSHSHPLTLLTLNLAHSTLAPGLQDRVGGSQPAAWLAEDILLLIAAVLPDTAPGKVRGCEFGTVTSTMHRAAHPSGRARCGAGADCSAIKYQPLSVSLSGKASRETRE